MCNNTMVVTKSHNNAVVAAGNWDASWHVPPTIPLTVPPTHSVQNQTSALAVVGSSSLHQPPSYTQPQPQL